MQGREVQFLDLNRFPSFLTEGQNLYALKNIIFNWMNSIIYIFERRFMK